MLVREKRLYHRLQVAAHCLQKTADREIGSRLDITTAQAAVLSVLTNQEGTTHKEIADALGFNQSAVTAMINRLISLDYVARVRNPNDGRSWILQMTPEGTQALELTRSPFSKVNSKISDTLDEDEILALSQSLEKLIRAFRS